jgi:holin-like protein
MYIVLGVILMNVKRTVLLCRRYLRGRRSLQLGLIVLFWMAGSFLVRVSRIPLPAGIAGMLLVLALFVSGRLSPLSLHKGANWLISEMLLFFVPAVLAVLDHREFLGLLGLKILVAILLGTVVVMSATALTSDICFRLMRSSRSESYARS